MRITAISSALLAAVSVSAVTITFDDMPDGTLISAGNPYFGVATIQAHSREVTMYDADGPPVIVEREFKINGGIAREREFLLEESPGPFEHRFWRTEMTIEFAQPVETLSFVAEAFREAAFFFTMSNGAETQEGFFNFGGHRDHKYAAYAAEVPDGFRITGAALINQDDMLPGFADFTVDSITFTLPSESPGLVPDSGPSIALLAAAMCLTIAASRRLTAWQP